MYSLQNYFRISAFSITVVLFTLFYFFASYLHTSMLQEEHRKTSAALSEQVFSSMYQVMRKGWSRSDLETFLGSIENSFENTGLSIAVYRGKKVESLFGAIAQPPFSDAVAGVFESAQKHEIMNDATIATITPIVAKAECLQCHTNAAAGDVLGAVEVTYAYGEMLQDVWYKHFIFSLLLFPLILVVIYALSRNLLNKIDGSMESFRDQIRDINSVKDFKNFDVASVPSSFREFDAVIEELNVLTHKLKDIAVDKDILEFEVKLLDKLIITSEIVQDWKEYIKELLKEINTIMPVYSLITIFQTDEEYCEIEIFWLGKPSDICREYMEEMAKKMIAEHAHFDALNFSVRHNICDEQTCLISLAIEDIDHESKSLILDTPKIGGIVSLGAVYENILV